VNNDSEFTDLTLRSLYDGTTIYFGGSINTSEPALIGLVYQVNNSAPLFDPGPVWNNGNDAKMVDVENNTFDYVTAFGSPALDTQNGGANNVFGRCWTKNDSIDFEFSCPLDSGDTRGADIALRPGRSSVIFPVIFYSSPFDLHSLLQPNGDWDYITLELYGFIIPSYSIPILIVCALGVSSILILHIRKKKAK
jgi:hypothetical protein